MDLALVAQASTIFGDVEPTMWLSLFVGAVGIIVWAIRVEGRVNAVDKALFAFDKLIEERDERVKERLTRIEAKIDHGFRNGKS